MQDGGETAKRRQRDTRLFLVLGGISLGAPAAMNVYLPALPELTHALGASAAAAQLTVTGYIVGMLVGQLVAGPASDVYGRRRPLIVGLTVFVAASLGCAAMSSVFTLAGMRLLQGAGAATGMVIARAVVRDYFAGAAAARYLSQLVLIIGLGPAVAPLIGAQILRASSWRGTFVLLAAFATVLLAAAALLLPESLPPERRQAGGFLLTFRMFPLLTRDRMLVGCALATGLAACGGTAYLAGATFVLQDVYGVSPQTYSLLFGASALAMIAVAQLNARLVGLVPPRRLAASGFSLMLAGGLGLLAVVRLDAGLAAAAVCLTLVISSWNLIQANLIALALTEHPDAAGAASALLGISQYAFSAIAPPLVAAGGSHSALPLALVVVGAGVSGWVALATLIAPIPRLVTAVEQA